MFGPYDLSGAIADDDTGCHGVIGRYTRHDGSVSDTKVVDSVDPEMTVYDRHGIAPHLEDRVSAGGIAFLGFRAIPWRCLCDKSRRCL
jgi:hypothetical protein